MSDEPERDSEKATVPRGPASVAVVIAAYRSERTIGRALDALLAQHRAPDEIVVCDSSPDDATASSVREHPRVRLLHSDERLLPQQARARAVEATSAELLLFTDPDVYAEPDWIEKLVALHGERQAAVVGGALACWDRDWFNRGIHVCKFGRWLPGGSVRAVDNVPTASLLIERDLYERLGGFDHPLFGDALLSRRASVHGAVLLEPRAIAHHDHGARIGAFLRERFERGRSVGRDTSVDRLRAVALLVLTVVPVRLLRRLASSWTDCRRGPGLGTWLRALPVVALGHSASLAGEAWGLLGRVVSGAKELGRA